VLIGSVRTIFNRLPEMMVRLPVEAGGAVNETAEAVASAAQSNAPVDTGALRASIDVTKTGSTAAQVTTGVDYAIYQEYGTYKMPAHPFMTPAAEAERGRYLSRFQNLLQ